MAELVDGRGVTLFLEPERSVRGKDGKLKPPSDVGPYGGEDGGEIEDRSSRGVLPPKTDSRKFTWLGAAGLKFEG